MLHIHRAETWRHPETKARALVWNVISGRMSGATVDRFVFRSRLSFRTDFYACADDAREALKSAGFVYSHGKAQRAA